MATDIIARGMASKSNINVETHTNNNDIHVTASDKSNWNNKVNKNQGAENSGKVLGTNANGEVIPLNGYGFEYDEETKMLKYGTDPTSNLNQGIGLDDTLSKKGYAADAGAVGELKEDLSESTGFEKVSNTWQGTGLFHTDGSFVENSNFHYSVPIKLVKGQVISVYCFLTDVIFAKIFEVDESGNFVRNLVNNPVWSDYSQSEFLCQNDEMYVSYCARTGSNEDCIVKKYTELAKQFELLNVRDDVEFLKTNSVTNFTYNRLKTILSPVPFPSGFNWDSSNLPISLYRNIYGEISTDIEDKDYTTDGVTYYVSPTGNNDNDGLTENTALRSVYIAREKSDCRRIIIKAGWYAHKNSFLASPAASHKSIDIVGIGNVYLTTSYDVNWTLHSTNVYKCTRSATANIIDTNHINEEGDFVKYDLVDSIATVASTEGTWYIDSSNNVYVHTIGNEVPDNGFIKVLLSERNFHSSGDYRIYMENVKIYGGGALGSCTISNTGDSLAVFKNCEFKYNSGGDGAFSSVGYNTILINCIASMAHSDAFNYHKNGSKIANAIEVNCIGRNSGTVGGSSSDQGTTIHDGSKIIRLNGIYSNTVGAPITDVNEGTKSWCLGCISEKSQSTGQNTNANFAFLTGAEAWLDTCGGRESELAYTVDSQSKLHLHNCIFDTNSFYATGEVTNY